MTKKNKHVALVMGGMSAEREVSLMSGKGIEKALRENGYQVTVIDLQRDIAEKLSAAKPDVVFNALHGTYGEDGCLQGLLEILGIPYTHSGILASALAMDKPTAKNVLQDRGILCPPGAVVSTVDIANGNIPFPKPYVIKPISEGSSVGVYIIKEGVNGPNMAEIKKYHSMLVEKYIPGRELSVAVTDEKPLGVVEIRPKNGFYDYTNKYSDGKTEHLMPAPVNDSVYKEAMDIAFKAHKMLGCRGVSRSDFRLDEADGNKLYLLEINTHPGMTPLSLVPEIASHVGISFNELIKYLVENARCDNK